MADSVAVHFKQRFPIFPLPETMLLPHAVMPLSVFDPKYTQLTNHSLDASGQIAIATYTETNRKQHREGVSPIRDVVCLAQIVQHEKVGNGYNMLVYGLCRAKVIEECAPSGDVLYRTASLKPLQEDEEELDEIYRVELLNMLHRPNLARLENHESIVSWVIEQNLSDSAIFEVIGCSVFDDPELRYELLSEPSSEKRSKKVLSELARLDRLLSVMDSQSSNDLENGISKN